MTVKELKNLIDGLPDDLAVTYNYDTGHGYPTFNAAYTAELPAYYENGGKTVLVLDESSPREYQRADGLSVIDELFTK